MRLYGLKSDALTGRWHPRREAWLAKNRKSGAAVARSPPMSGVPLPQQPALQLIYDTAPIGLAFLSPDCRYMQINQRLTEICGISVEDHLGRSVRDCVPALADAVEDVVRSIMKTGEPVIGIEVAGQHADQNEERSWVTYWHPLRNPQGEIVGVNVAAEEVTERKRTEAVLAANDKALRESELRFRELADNISQFAWTADAKGWIYWYNKRWHDYTGTTLEDMEGWGWQKVHHPEHVERVVERIRQSFETGTPWEDTFPLRGKDGDYRWFLSRALPIRNEAGDVIHWFGTDTDVTEQIEAENALRVSVERQTATADILRVIASSPSDVRPVFDAIAERSNWLTGGHSTAVVRIIDDLVDLVAFTSVNPEADAALRASFPRPVTDYPLIDLIRDGQVLEIADSESELGMRTGARDIGRARGFRSLLLTPLRNEKGLIGLISVSRKEPGTFADHHVQLLRTFADQAVIAIENVRLFDELQARTRELSLSLEELSAAQDRLVQTEKLAALGRLVAGVAHEINNPVGTSLTVASALELKTTAFTAEAAQGNLKRSHLTEFLQTSREASAQLVANLNHAAELIQSFKQVATDRYHGDQRVFDLGGLTEQIAKSLRPGAGKQKPLLNVECTPNLTMNSYPGPYGQVLTNLFLNSVAHAFPDGKGGAVDIRVRAAGEDDVEVVFSDDGCGMSLDVQHQAFDPFFTTRRDQGGTGLGLHIVHSIVTSCLGGRLHLDSVLGRGTTIRLILPRVAPQAPSPR
jgi:PAS domain S-box-containing protein